MGIAVAVLLLALVIAAPAHADVRLADGVEMERVARGIPDPSNVALDPRGGIWVTSAGNLAAGADGVWYVRAPGAEPRHVASGLFSALGLLWHDGRLYVSHVVPHRTFAPRHTGRVTAFWGFDGERFAHHEVIVDGIPTGRHRVDSLAAGPDGRLYLGVGSQFDNRRSTTAPTAGVVSFRPDGRGGVRVEARGLRNPYGLAFVPGTGDLLVSEHGRDDLGLDRPPEELNAVQTGGRARWYGFPDCWGQGGAACRGARRPIARLAPHSAPGAVAVAPAFGRWGLSAFVPRFGSSFAARPTGGDVVRIALLRVHGRWRTRVHRFAGGLGRQEPLGAAVGPDGALYVTLWRSGEVVRFSAPSAARGLAVLLLRLVAQRQLDVLLRAGNALLDLP
jgi:glucose/arabinose dehydrogenase